MRRLPVCVIAILLLLSAMVAQAQPAEPPTLRELRIYFLHLANIDAAADKAEAEGTPGDTAAWRRFEQEKAGLTETEAALLKDVAFRCNRALEENLGGQEPMEIVRQAVDELRTVLGSAAFEAVSQRIQTFLRPAITNVPAAVLEGTEDEEEEIPIEIEAFTGPSVSVVSLLFKLQDGNYMAQCSTSPNDADTINQYAGGVTLSCQVNGGGLSAPFQVPCGSNSVNTSCSGTYPPAPPGRTRVLSATHGLRMKSVSNVCQIPYPVYYDPLAFCRTGRQPPFYIDAGNVPPLPNGQPMCWDPEVLPNVCTIATTGTAQISFIELSPSEATAYPSGTVQFSSAGLQAVWTVESGPGTINNAGIYTAPYSITSQQTVTVKGCDAYAPGDCDTATVTLKPLQVQVAPSPVEVLPEGQTMLTATIVPAVSGQLINWSMTPNVGTLTPSGNTATYTAPIYEQLAGNTEITVTACLSPATSVCSTATVIVPKLLFTITAPKTKLDLNETVQVTAFLQGSNVQRAIFWKTPSYGTLSVISEADPFIRLYKAPGSPPFADVVIEACLVANPTFCAQLPLDLPEPLRVISFESDTGRWQAGTLTDFTITGEGFRPGLQIEMGGLPVTVTSMTETVIKGKVRILAPATGVPLSMSITYPDGSFSSTTRSPKEVEPATVAVSPGTAQVPGGGSKVFDSVCRTSTTQPCTSQEIPSWTASQGSVNPTTGLSTTYTAPASVESESSATVTACWYFGAQSKCGFAVVSLLPNGPIVSVTPETANVKPGESESFTAHVTNDPNTVVTWSIQPQIGSITQGGVYTAPSTFGGAATVTVTATSVVDSSRKDTATVTLVPAPLAVTSTASPAWVNYGTLVNWTATAAGGVPPYQYALFRRKQGSPNWIPSLSAGVWQAGNNLSWTPALSDAGTWEIRIGARDANTPAGSPVLYDPGLLQVRVPLSVTCTPSPAYANPGTMIAWTATATGGDPATIRYAFFRKKVGTTTWTPDVTLASWQVSNSSSWTPASADVGTWEFSIWVKDANTPANSNIYGFAGYCNPGPTQVVAPLTLTSTPSPAGAYSGQPIKWTLTTTGGVPGTIQYHWSRRRAGTADWINSGWQTSNEVTWTPSTTEAGSIWDISFIVKDSLTTPTQNTYGYAAWYNPASVPVFTAPTVTCTASPASSTYGTTLSWTATVSGGSGAGRQYAFFRRRSGTTPWTPPVTAPSWQASNVMTWTPGAADAGAWDTYIWVKDSITPSTMNNHGYAVGCNPGGIQIVAPLSVTSTASPALVTSGNAVNWTATATGGDAASTQFAVVRRISGTATWSNPVWQASGSLSWTPASTEVGTWEISIRVRDGNTPAGAYAAAYNPGNVQVVAPLSVTGTSSPSAYYHSNPITWTATGSGGTGVGRQYAFFRKKVGAASWIPDVSAPAWQASNVMGWTPASTDVGTWEIVIWFKDANTPSNANGYGYGAYYNAGPVQVYAHPTVSGTGSPSSVSYGTTITWTATGSGGIGSAKQYALFRKKVGTSNWIPALTSPGWQAGNVLSWTPGSADVGTWEIFVWMKDANTPSTMNTYGHAAWYNAGLVEVTGPLTLTSCSSSPVSSNHGKAITWTVSASGGHAATVQYALFRKRAGTSTWIPAQTTPSWHSGNVLSWTPASGDVGGWDITIWIRDGNTSGSYAASCSPGQVQVTNPLSLSIVGTPSSSPHGTTITWTATATGGHASTIQYALFRRRPGTGNAGWIPSIYSPAWQSSRYLSWTPTEDEVGTWEIYAWVKDSSTSPTQLTYGYAAGANGGAVEITAPIYQSYDPIGWVDGVDNQWIWGWACDPDYPWESNRVDLWTTSWQFLGSAEADGGSSTPINNACGGGSAHYFAFYHGGSIPSGTHFWVWSIDLPYSTPGGVNVPIGGFSGSNEFVMP